MTKVRTVDGYAQRFSVSEAGQVWDRQKREWIEPNPGTNLVQLGASRRRIAELVAEAWLPREPWLSTKMITYRDGNPSNYHVSNLSWKMNRGRRGDTKKYEWLRISDGKIIKATRTEMKEHYGLCRRNAYKLIKGICTKSQGWRLPNG